MNDKDILNSFFSECINIGLSDGEVIINDPNFENEVKVGSIAKYFCNEGFVLVGDATRCCMGDGMWSRLLTRGECFRKLPLVLNSS